MLTPMKLRVSQLMVTNKTRVLSSAPVIQFSNRTGDYPQGTATMYA
jgi:hypothetical protein